MYRLNNGQFVFESIYDFLGCFGLKAVLRKRNYFLYFRIFILPTIFVKDYYLPKGCRYL